jgi:starvation-inducible DNA-binding protein
MAEPLHKLQEETSASVVNHLVANLGVLHVKLHQYHWHVKGPEFYRLHEKFEELYNEVNTYFDEFAERLLQIGVRPYSTLEEYSKHAFIEEKVYRNEISADNMVKNVVEDYKNLREFTEKGIALAGDEGDTVTEDMLIEYKSQLDFHLWTLEAYLGNDAK